ncbi:MAG: glycine dehydrogenase, partial [Actinomycetota bacterium]
MNSIGRSLTSPGFTHDDFAYRHLGLSDNDRQHMLNAINASSVEELLLHTVPSSIRLQQPLAVPPALPEHVVLDVLKKKFSGDVKRTSLIGQGYYDTITPSVLRRNMIENPAWYTAYTPYQPEISQGRLEALLNFQTMISELTGLELSNASLLDEATAVAEAITMAHRASKSTSSAVLVDENIHPQIRRVVETRLQPIGIEIHTSRVDNMSPDAHFAVVVSWPGSNGQFPSIARVQEIVDAAHSNGALTISVCDLLACSVVVPPGELNFDIAVGSSQRFGVPMGFGGPHAAFMATRAQFARTLPGRLVGVSTDTQGRPALRLTLQTREQHIRREKATSNICTAQVLLANVAGMFGVWHGPDGLQRIAHRIQQLTARAASSLQLAGHQVATTEVFDTVAVSVDDATSTVSHFRDNGFNIRLIDSNTVSFSFDETTSEEVAEKFIALWDTSLVAQASPLPREVQRTSTFMQQSVFHKYRTEHEMLRYLRFLADKDLALDRTMIPLGSCTMKLNSTTEMEPITWPEFSSLHPYVPEDESHGIRSVISELEQMLLAITGYDAISLQPNAGSQGEFAGLLAIRAYHDARGDHRRRICLIPSSAHGTNAASAVMAGMDVVVVSCDDEGNIDLDDLTTKAHAAGDRLAATMITYPSTHGVFEEHIAQICAVIHDNGG